jgi:hypothetical protein
LTPPGSKSAISSGAQCFLGSKSQLICTEPDRTISGERTPKINAKTLGVEVARYGDRIKEVGRWRRRVDTALFIGALTAIIVAMLVLVFLGLPL